MATRRRTKEEVEILPGGDWMSAKWRPAMGWMYMAVCIFDFIIFPILWTIIQAYDAQGVVTTEWDPLTLKGGGLFHVAMGGVLGVAAWSRGQEKITAMNNGYEPTIAPAAIQQPYNPVYRQPYAQSRSTNRSVPVSEDPVL
jgi:hypothetical protein